MSLRLPRRRSTTICRGAIVHPGPNTVRARGRDSRTALVYGSHTPLRDQPARSPRGSRSTVLASSPLWPAAAVRGADHDRGAGGVINAPRAITAPVGLALSTAGASP